MNWMVTGIDPLDSRAGGGKYPALIGRGGDG